MIKFALYPWNDDYLNNKIFERKNVYPLLDDERGSNPFYQLKKEIELDTDFKLDTIDLCELDENTIPIFFDVPNKRNKYYLNIKKMGLLNKSILFIWEPESVKKNNFNLKQIKQFKYVFTWNDDLVDNDKTLKFYYMQPLQYQNEFKKNFNEKKNLCLISANKNSSVLGELYSERKAAIEYYENRNIQFDLYGFNWDKYIIWDKIKIKRKPYKVYRGITNLKVETLSNYKFAICYENQRNLNGYITEKIFDCFISGTIPIYLGAPNICEYIPKECFIDKRDFNTYEELTAFITSITNEQYKVYINNIDRYLKSGKAYKFSEKYFVDYISDCLKKIAQTECVK